MPKPLPPVDIETYFKDTFQDKPTCCASAPGRIEFIGNHTDYNGGNVLGAAIDRRIHVALSLRDDRSIHAATAVLPGTTLLSLDDLQRQTGRAAWTNYPIGVLKMLMENGLKVDRGFNLAVLSEVPRGAGLSSSAALELATARALTAAFGASYEPHKMARLCRKAENEFVGMPCGILDQGVSTFGKKGHLLHIDCESETYTPVPLPTDACLWIFNTHDKHSLIDSLYATRHRECMEAFNCLAPFYPEAKNLSDLTLEQVEAREEALSEERYGRARHITSENARVAAMIEALAQNDLDFAGQLLIASHVSSRDDFENSTLELDFLVEHIFMAPNVYGARLTGGGFGGAVMALTSTAFTMDQAAAIGRMYAELFAIDPEILPCQTDDGVRLC